MPAQTTDLSKLTDHELVTSLASLVDSERASLVQSLLRLGELESRKLHLQAGYPNLFDYCTRVLRLSNGSTHRRTHGARLLRRFPEIADWLIDGRVSLTKLVLAERLFSEANLSELLTTLSTSTEREVEKLVVTAFPQPAVADSIRRAPARPISSPPAAAPAPDAEPVPLPSPPPGADGDPRPASRSPTSSGTQLFALASPAPRKRPDVVTPHSATETFFRFTARDALHEQINQATSLLSHKFPNGRLEDILGECLEIALPILLQRRIGAGGRKKASRKHPTSATEVTSASVTSATLVAPQPPSAPVTSATTAASTPNALATQCPSAPVTSATEVASAPISPARQRASAPVTSATEVASAPVAAAAVTSATEMAWPCDVDPEVPPDLFSTDHRSRHIPSELAAEICARDGWRCAFEGPDGVRCGSTHMLEIDHIWPFALGGEATRENLRLLCRAHNSYWAEQFFGRQLFREPEHHH